MCYLESSVYWSDPGHLGGAGVSLAWSLLAFVDQVHFMSILGRVSDNTALLAFSEKLSWINYDFTTLSLEDGAEETSEPLAAESCGVSITVGFLQRILTCLALNLSAVAVASFYTWRSRRKNRALRKELGSGVEEGVKATAVEDGTAPGVKLENMDEKDKDMSWSEMSHSMSVWVAPLLLSQVIAANSCLPPISEGKHRTLADCKFFLVYICSGILCCRCYGRHLSSFMQHTLDNRGLECVHDLSVGIPDQRTLSCFP